MQVTESRADPLADARADVFDCIERFHNPSGCMSAPYPLTAAHRAEVGKPPRCGLLAERAGLAATKYGGVRDDIQNFRRIFAESGLAGIRAARDSGVAIPAWVLAFLGAHLLRGQREGG